MSFPLKEVDFCSGSVCKIVEKSAAFECTSDGIFILCGISSSSVSALNSWLIDLAVSSSFNSKHSLGGWMHSLLRAGFKSCLYLVTGSSAFGNAYDLFTYLFCINCHTISGGDCSVGCLNL